MPRGYTYIPVGEDEGEKISDLPTEYLRGWLQAAEKLSGLGGPRGDRELNREQLSRLDRSIEIEYRKRKKEKRER